MEEDFKKMEEGICRGEGCSTNALDGNGEGAEELLDGIMEELREVGEVLDCEIEDLRTVVLPAREAKGDMIQEVLDCADGVAAVLEDAALGGGGRGDGGKVLGELERGGSKVLDWKKAVLGGGGRRGGAAEGGLALLRGKDGESAVLSGGKGGIGDGNGETFHQSKMARDSVEDFKPGKHCRELKFEEGVGSFLGADGVTVQVDKVAVAECEKDLERALVGKILGRQVPFGFLNRELRKKWGKFGRAHLSMVEKNSFVCFFSSKEVRDKVLKGGPWFVGNQLVGVARWSATFDPSSIKGFSTPIWIRFPQLPLNLWSDQNLGRIAAMIGQPLWVDEVTSSWGRTEFARVCVRINFEKKLPKGVWVQGVENRFFQRVEYEGIDQICFHCGEVGHVNGSCLERASRGEEGKGGDKPLVASQVDDDVADRGVPASQAVGISIGLKDHQPPSVFGHVVSRHSQEGVVKNGVGLGDAKRQVRGQVGPTLGENQKSEGVAVEAGLEDVEGGGWTFVARRKAGFRPKKKGVKPKGLLYQGLGRMGVLDGRKELEGEASLSISGRKPVKVYRRVDRSSSKLVPSGVVDGGGSSTQQLDRSLLPGGCASTGLRGKRPLEGGSVGGDLSGGVQGEVGPGALVVFQPALAVSLVEELEGLKKRRKGEVRVQCGGDASPLVT